MAKKEENKTETKKAGLFSTYGEFDSVEELNAKAEELKTDKQALHILASENGIDVDMIDLYQQGFLPHLVPDVMTAAIGKLEVEVADLSDKNREVGSGIADYLKQKSMEDEKIARAVRKKGKSLKTICDEVWKEASKRKKGGCAYIPPFEVFQLARAYYLKEDKA